MLPVSACVGRLEQQEPGAIGNSQEAAPMFTLTTITHIDACPICYNRSFYILDHYDFIICKHIGNKSVHLVDHIVVVLHEAKQVVQKCQC